MSQSPIFGPFFVTMILTLVVWVYMYVRRIAFINSRKFKPGELSPAKFAELSPPAVSNPSDNLKNLFEMPVIFYALSLYLYATNHVDAGYVDAAWVFAIFRILHSGMHCTVNIVIVRFYLYAISAVALWFMVIRAALAYLGT